MHRTARRRVIDWTGWCSDCARACGEGALATWCLLDHGLTLSWVVDVVGLVEMSARLSTHYWSRSGPQEFRDRDTALACVHRRPGCSIHSSLAPSRIACATRRGFPYRDAARFGFSTWTNKNEMVRQPPSSHYRR